MARIAKPNIEIFPTNLIFLDNLVTYAQQKEDGGGGTSKSHSGPLTPHCCLPGLLLIRSNLNLCKVPTISSISSTEAAARVTLVP